MSHNVVPDINSALTDAQRLAKLKIAQRCQSDLYFLCRYVLGYTLMTDGTHLELCHYAQSIASKNAEPQTLPHSNREVASAATTRKSVANLPPDSPQKILGGLDVPPTFRKDPTEEELYNPAISDTPPESVVHTAVTEKFDANLKQLLILMPRGAFKSSVVTIGLSLQMILNDPDVRILIDSETFAKAKAFLAEIKGHLEGNEMFREIYHTIYNSYPDSKKRDDVWSDSQVNISARKRNRKEPTLSCGGVDVTKNGMHYDLIIMDDLHSELNTANKEQIDKVIHHYKLAFSLLDPGCPIIVIGTRWNYNDVYQHILDEEIDNYNVLVRSAHNPDGTLFFPERLTEEFLQKTKRTQGSYLYSCQYENNPVDDESATFKRSSLVRVPWSLTKSMPMNWYLSVDPSYAGPYSDYAALVIAGMNHQKDLYVRHVLRKKMTYAQIIEAMFDLYNRFAPRQILLETIAAQKSIQYELSNEQKRRGTWLPITEIRSRSKSKEDRIRALAPFYEFGHIFHIKECAQLDDLEYELIHFPKGTHDDVIDALATVLEVAKPAGSMDRSAKRERNKERYDVLTKPRSPLTGV
jgi:predicted phage terminase large subunit-like protein